MSDYHPVSCGVHSEYELLAMHRRIVQLTYIAGHKITHTVTARVMDIVTRNKAEYMLLRTPEGVEVCIRLDQIQLLQIEC